MSPRRVAFVLAACALVAFVALHSRERAVAGPPARIVHFELRSRAVGATLRETLVLPPHYTPRRGLVVFLHARGGTDETNLGPWLSRALARLGPAAPAIVFPGGGPRAFWHDRRDGAWGRYVLDEVLPRALALSHADPHRVALGGISMGGFGALDLARERPGRFCAVGGHSAALGPATLRLAGSFDGPRDFARHDLLGLSARRPQAFAGTSVWIDVGAQDPFAAADRTFAARLRAAGVPVAFHVWSGKHDGAYWHAHWVQYLRFYAAALARCGRPS